MSAASSFEREVLTGLGQIHSKVNDLSDDVGDLKALYDRVTTVEVQQRNCPAREAANGVARREAASNRIAFAAAIIAVVSVVVTWILAGN
jgi:hypothetical protein